MNLSIFLFFDHFFFFFCYDLNKCVKKSLKNEKKVLLKKIIKVQSINFQDYFDYNPYSIFIYHFISYPHRIKWKNMYREWCS
jgi:hypothetical protein